LKEKANVHFSMSMYIACTEHLIDCWATEQRRFQTYIWVCEADGCTDHLIFRHALTCLEQSKNGQATFLLRIC